MVVLVDARVLEDQLGLDVEDPGGVLGALDVAADPEHRLRDPAQHDGSRLARVGLLLLLLLLVLLAGAGRRGPARRSAASAGRRRRARGSLAPRPARPSGRPAPRCPWSRRRARSSRSARPRPSATRVRPPGSTQTRLPSLTANGRRSTWRGPHPAVDERRHGATAGRPAGRSRRAGRPAPCARSSSSSAAVGARADHDALAAGAVDRLEHQLVEAVEHLLAGVGVAAAARCRRCGGPAPRRGSSGSGRAGRCRRACRRRRRCRPRWRA